MKPVTSRILNAGLVPIGYPGASQFEQEFPDKKKEYVFISDNYDGIEMADALTKKGYKISWMIGGLDRWEWYMNNTEDFKCNDRLVEK